MHNEETYWTERYKENRTGWDIGYPSTPIKTYIDQLQDKSIKILIPGAGNAYEAEYLFKNGFHNVYVLDISKKPFEALKSRIPEFPNENLIHGDFFKHDGQYDLIFEQTFFCSFEPSVENRKGYARKMSKLIGQGGKLVGLWFKHALTEDSKRPFGGTKDEYLSYLDPYFKTTVFEDCHNSIKTRMGNELFGMFEKK